MCSVGCQYGLPPRSSFFTLHALSHCLPELKVRRYYWQVLQLPTPLIVFSSDERSVEPWMSIMRRILRAEFQRSREEYNPDGFDLNSLPLKPSCHSAVSLDQWCRIRVNVWCCVEPQTVKASSQLNHGSLTDEILNRVTLFQSAWAYTSRSTITRTKPRVNGSPFQRNPFISIPMISSRSIADFLQTVSCNCLVATGQLWRVLGNDLYRKSRFYFSRDFCLLFSFTVLVRFSGLTAFRIAGPIISGVLVLVMLLFQVRFGFSRVRVMTSSAYGIFFFLAAIFVMFEGTTTKHLVHASKTLTQILCELTLILYSAGAHVIVIYTLMCDLLGRLVIGYLSARYCQH